MADRSGADVAWIEKHTAGRKETRSAVPPLFEAYSTIHLPVTPSATGGWSWKESAVRHDASVLGVISQHTAFAPQAWRLGYLETGIDAKTIFYDVPKTMLHGWEYVLIEAGREQAGTWRAEWDRWKGVLPDLMFPGRSLVACAST